MKYRHHKFWRLIVWLTIYGLVCPPSYVFAAGETTPQSTRPDPNLAFQKSQAAQARRDAQAAEEARIAAEKAKINEANRLQREANAKRNREIQEAHDAAIKAARKQAAQQYDASVAQVQKRVSEETAKEPLVGALFANRPVRSAPGAPDFPEFGGGIKNIATDRQFLSAFTGYLGNISGIASKIDTFVSFDMAGMGEEASDRDGMSEIYNIIAEADAADQKGENPNTDPLKDAITQVGETAKKRQVVSAKDPEDAEEAKRIARAHVVSAIKTDANSGAILDRLLNNPVAPTPTSPTAPTSTDHRGNLTAEKIRSLSAADRRELARFFTGKGAGKYLKNVNTLKDILGEGSTGLQSAADELARAAELEQKGPSLIDPNEGTTDPSVADAGRGAAGGGGSPSDSGAGDSGAGSGGGGGGSGDGGGGGNDGGGNLEAAKVPGPGEIPKSPDFSGLRQPESDINPVAQGIQGLQGEQTALSTFNSPVTPLQVQRIQKRTVPNTGNQQFASNTRLRPGFPFPGGSSSVGSALSNNFFGGNGAVPLSGEIARGAGGGGGGGGGGSGFTGNPFNVGADFGGRPPKLNAVKTVAYGSGGGANGSDDGGSSIATGAAGFSPQLQRQLLGGRAFKDPPEKGKLGLLSRVGTLLSDLCDDSTQKDITGVCGNAEEVRQKAVAREISGTPSRTIASVPEEAQGLVKEGVVTQ